MFIGVDDNERVIGVEADYKLIHKKDRNGYELFLSDLIFHSLGDDLAPFVKLSAGDVDGKDIWRIACSAASRPVYLKDKSGEEKLFIRRGNSTVSLTAREAVEYVKVRWKNQLVQISK